MRRILQILAFIFSTVQVNGQDCYVENRELLQNDFSNLWRGSTFQGTIGSNNQRIEIRFITVSKVNDTTYAVTGKSKVNMNICDFAGKFKLSTVEIVKPECNEPYNSEGIITAFYKIEENKEQNHVGIFSGIIQTMFDKTEQGLKQFPGWYSDEGVNTFIGEWQEYGKMTSKYCSWGLQIPPTKRNDLFKHYDNEFYLFNPKYLDKGWKSYVLAHLGSFVRVPKDFNTDKTRYSADFMTFTKQVIDESKKMERLTWWK